jgi:hypothetical protein
MPWGLCGGGSLRRPPGLSPCVHRGDRRGGVRDATSTTSRLHRTSTPSDVDKGRCIPRGEAPPSPVSEFWQASPCRWERWQVPTPQLKDARGDSEEPSLAPRLRNGPGGGPSEAARRRCDCRVAAGLRRGGARPPHAGCRCVAVEFVSYSEGLGGCLRKGCGDRGVGRGS